MRHQVEISKIRMRDIVRIHHHARRAVSISKVIRVTRVMREELDMVPLPDHDECHGHTRRFREYISLSISLV